MSDRGERQQAAQAALDAAGVQTVQRAAYLDYLARFGDGGEPLEFAAWSDEAGEAALGAYRLSLLREETFQGLMRRLGRRAPTEDEIADTAAHTVPEWFFRSFVDADEV